MSRIKGAVVAKRMKCIGEIAIGITKFLDDLEAKHGSWQNVPANYNLTAAGLNGRTGARGVRPSVLDNFSDIKNPQAKEILQTYLKQIKILKRSQDNFKGGW